LPAPDTAVPTAAKVSVSEPDVAEGKSTAAVRFAVAPDTVKPDEFVLLAVEHSCHRLLRLSFGYRLHQDQLYAVIDIDLSVESMQHYLLS
jgi:hypothetical protein